MWGKVKVFLGLLMIGLSIWDIFSTRSLILNFASVDKVGEVVEGTYERVQETFERKPRKASVILTGDVMLGRSVMTTSISKNNYSYPFELVSEKLGEADIALVNLENPVVEGCPETSEGMVFCSKPFMLDGLKQAGVDIVNLVNNHTKNYGESGYVETKKHLEDWGLEYIDEGELLVHEAGGVTFGFLGLDMTARSDMLSDNELWVVRKSSERVDNLIVSVHWGIEYQVQPTSLQRKWARQLVENGADVVWGHHPHVVGEVGYIQQKPIFYSLGNFVFDQMWSEKTKRGMVVELTFEGENLVGEKREEVYMQQWARPAWQ